METTYYTLTAREIIVEGAAVQCASGDGARRLVCVRRTAQKEAAPSGKVIDLAAWKAEREDEVCPEELWYDEEGETAEAVAGTSVSCARRSGKSGLSLDLWASIGVIGVVAVLLVRVLFAF